jgi:hypothetical protein
MADENKQSSQHERAKWSHVDEKRIVIDWSSDFIVFLDAKGELDWETSPEFDQKTNASQEFRTNQNAILGHAALLEAKPSGDLSEQNREWFRYLVGKAMVFGFDRDYANAQKMLDKAEQYFRTRSEELSRWWYLTASVVCTLPFVGLGGIVWMLDPQLLTEGGESETLPLLALFLAAGATGALLSIIARSGQLHFDCSAGRWLHYLEALSRIVTGAFAGIVVGLALKSKLIFEPLSKSDALMFLAAFAGGASERLLGSIISKFDSSALSDKPNTPPGSPST